MKQEGGLRKNFRGRINQQPGLHMKERGVSRSPSCMHMYEYLTGTRKSHHFRVALELIFRRHVNPNPRMKESLGGPLGMTSESLGYLPWSIQNLFENDLHAAE